MSVIGLTKKNRIVPEDYVNKLTGETLADEFPDLVTVQSIVRDTLKVKYNRFVVVNQDAMDYINMYFNDAEANRVNKMTNMIDRVCNGLIKDDGDFHTPATLKTSLNYDSRNRFAKFLKKLYEHSVINLMISRQNGRDVAILVLNPYLAKKRETFDVSILSQFKDIGNARNHGQA